MPDSANINELLAERAATHALISFYAALDATDYDAVTSSFTQDGVWHRQGKALAGPAMLRDAMAQRPAGTRTRHVVTNMLTAIDTDGRAELNFYLTGFSHVGEADAPLPAPMSLPNSVGHTRAVLRLEDGVWKITELRSFPTFQR